MKRISRFFHYPPEPRPEPPDVLSMIPPSERLEYRERPPTDGVARFLVILGATTLYVAGVVSAVWLVAYVAAHAVRFAWGF